MAGEQGEVFTGHTRTGSQEAVYKEIAEEGVCPFCEENFRWHPNPILRKSDWWIVTTNMEPYEGSKHHFLLILRQVCVSRLGEVPNDARLDLFDQIDQLQQQFDFAGAAALLRFGDMTYNGGSVKHLHVHVVVGSVPHSDSAKRIRVKVGYYDSV